MTDKTLNTVDQWIAVLVEVLKDHGRPMHEDAAVKLTAKICKVSPTRMPFVVNSAATDGLIVRDVVTGMLTLP